MFFLLNGLLFPFFSFPFAQLSNFQFDHFSTPEGLSSPRVSSLALDEKGFLWAGTDYGLNRFDGYQFRVYTHNPGDKRSLSDNRIWTLFRSRQGTLWVGTAEGLDKYDKDRDQFTHYTIGEKISESNESNFVLSIAEDQKGKLWLGTSQGELYYFDPREESVRHIPLKKNGKKVSWIWRLWVDSSGDLWIGTRFDGLFRLKQQGEKIDHYPFDAKNPDNLNGPWVNVIYEDQQANLWVGTRGGGLHVFDRENNYFKRFTQNFPPELDQPIFRAIQEDRQGRLWLVSNQGIYIWNRHAKKIILLQNDPLDEKSLSNNSVSCIAMDQSGSMWIGGDAINYWNPSRQAFLYEPVLYQGKPDKSLINAFWEKANGNLLFISSSARIYEWNKAKGVVSVWDQKNGLPSFQFLSFFQDQKGQFWIGTRNGILQFPTFEGEKSQKLNIRHLKADLFSNKDIWTIYEDSKGNIWIGTFEGLNRYEPQTGTIVPYLHEENNPNSLSHSWIWSIAKGQDGSFWLGTTRGLNHFRPEEESFTHYFHNPEDPHSISHSFIWTIHQGQDGYLWLGTKFGLTRFDPRTEKAIHWSVQDGLPDNYVHQIQEDQHGNLWLITNQGLSKFTPQSEIFENYQPFGSQPNYSFQSFFKTSWGEMIYSVKGGFIHFHPDSIQTNPYEPPIVLSDFRLFKKSKSSKTLSEDTIFTVTYKDELKLKYFQNDFSISFSALNYLEPEKNNYFFRMHGYQQNWTETGAKQRLATYTNLPPGKYTFQVRASNNNGIWNPEPTSLKITILPPWWATNWAYTLYFILTFAILVVLYLLQKRRWQLQKRLELEQHEASRMKELDAWKTRFYMNITHEFRTPLTIILGISEQILNGHKEGIQNGMRMIKRNGNKLLRLINQMLDLSKLESGNLSMKYVQADVISYLKYLVESFHSLAKAKSIELHFTSKVVELYMDYDPQRLQQVISNLLANAIKFTPEKGDVYLIVDSRQSTVLSLSDHTWAGRQPGVNGHKQSISRGKLALTPHNLHLIIKDSGIGIPEDQLPHIFERFFQIENPNNIKQTGTGIGLALTKELVKLMGGEIWVESKVGQGTTFGLILPIRSSMSKVASPPRPVINDFLEEEMEIEQDSIIQNKELPSLLIVEDNKDVIHYITSFLQNYYRLELAYDGQEGIRKAIKSVPDLIISDVVMPKADGFELCRSLKKNIHTSHIPIILLTAKADIDSKLAGLELGADAYLAKPFYKKELLVRLNKLLESRRKLQERYQNFTYPQPTSQIALQREDAFIQQLLEVLEANYSNENFNIPELCQAMTMSRAQLYRKLKALTGIPAAQYLRSFRLKKAKTILKDQQLKVSDVAFLVGFKELAHFSKAFKEEFGYNPSELIR